MSFFMTSRIKVLISKQQMGLTHPSLKLFFFGDPSLKTLLLLLLWDFLHLISNANATVFMQND